MNIQVGLKLLARNGKDEYLFLRRSSSSKLGVLPWDIPGGRMKTGETLSDGLEREVFEETRLSVKFARLVEAQDIIVADKDIHVVRLTYLGEVKGGELKLSEEHSEYCWMTSGQVASELIDPYVREVMGRL